MKRNVLIFFFFMLFLTPLAAEVRAMPPLIIRSAASSGFGGSHVAFTDNVHALFVNPAAIMRVEQWSFVTLAPTIYSPQSTLTLFNSSRSLIQGDTNALGTAADTLSRQQGKMPLGLELREFPLSFAWVVNGFGVGLWNNTSVNFNIVGTNLEVQVMEDIMLPVGFSFKILDHDRHSFDAGITLKPFARVWLYEQESILNLLEEDSEFLDQVRIPLIAGAGFNLGFLYRWDLGFQAALTLDDIFTRGTVIGGFSDYVEKNTYYVPFTMNAGLAYNFVLGRHLSDAHPALRDLSFVLAFDWRDALGILNQDDLLNQRNMLLNLGLGLQVSMLNMFYFRLGMNDMLPALGIGFNLGPLKIDAAYYGKEFGNEPGQLSAAALDLSIALRPNASKMDWPWTRGSLIGLMSGNQ